MNRINEKKRPEKHQSLWYITLLGLMLFLGCQSLLEQDISGDLVTLNSPYNGLHSEDYTQTFWWDDVTGASGYNLQVVTPSFEQMKKLVLDTNITDNQFTYSFYPDTFTCRVRAYNAAYSSEYTYATFYIDSTEGPQEVVLKTPANNTITNDSSIYFSWYKAANATNYRIVIKEGDDLISSLILYTTDVTFPGNTLETPLITDGEYTWTVRSENEVGYSDYAPTRSLMIDRIAPGIPTISKPKPYDTISSFELAWKHESNTGSHIYDSLIVFKDSVSKTEFLTLLVNDTIYSYTGASNGWYRFKVKAVDAATNQSEWSNIRYFYLETTSEKK